MNSHKIRVPGYSSAVLRELDEYINTNVKSKDTAPFTHLHPNTISLTCPMRSHGVKEWSMKDFELGKELGSGSFGVVHSAIHKRSRLPCAIKLVNKEKLRANNELAHLFQEIKIHLELGFHPNIVMFYGCFDSPLTPHYIIVMELVEGLNLEQYIASIKGSTFLEVQHIFYQTLMALEFLHRNCITHRDLKSSNLLINPHSMEVKLMDFGLSIYFHQNHMKDVGTTYYLAPEIHICNKTHQEVMYDHKVDVWSTGILLYELLTGDVPFRFSYDDYMDFSEHLIEQMKKSKKNSRIVIPHFKSLIPKVFQSTLSHMLLVLPRQRPEIIDILNDPSLFPHLLMTDDHPQASSSSSPSNDSGSASSSLDSRNSRHSSHSLPANHTFSYDVLRHQRGPDVDLVVQHSGSTSASSGADSKSN